jgi:hypothetical protein
MLLAGSAQYKPEAERTGGWLFWVNILAQFVWMCVVFGLFLVDAEEFVSPTVKSSWPVVVN